MNLSVILFVHVSVCQELYLYMCFLVDVHVSLLSESLVIHLCVCVCVCVCVYLSVAISLGYTWCLFDNEKNQETSIGPNETWLISMGF